MNRNSSYFASLYTLRFQLFPNWKHLLCLASLVVILGGPIYSNTVGSTISATTLSDGTVRAKIHFKIPKGHHIYSKNPGSTGAPTQIKWNVPVGSIIEEYWPIPQTFTLGPIESLGYGRDIDVVYRIKAPSSVSTLTAQLNWVVCSDQCKPEHSQLSLSVSSLEADKFKHFPVIEILPVLLGAFLGGFLLNLMPCVFPVLSLKLIAIAKSNRSDRRTITLGNLFFTLGILTSMSLIGLTFYVYTQSNSAIAWGFQLQSPTFITILIAVFTAISLNLLGVFEFGLSLTRLPIAGKNYVGAFLNGALLTVVSTPCSGPFMGSAIAFASSTTPVLSAFIFIFLGLGVAMPYWLIILFPRLIAIIPKPGAWMETLRRGLAFPMLGSIVWLEWILANQLNAPVVIATLNGTLVFGSFLFWIYGKNQSRRYSFIILGLAIISIISLPLFRGISGAPANTEAQRTDDLWNTYDSASIQDDLRNGKTVLIDFTADWCLTCKFNDATTFNTAIVRAALSQHFVRAYRADWTSKSDAVGDAIRSYGRNSVPLYIVLYPDGRQKILPQIPTAKDINAALNRPQPH